MLTSLIGWMWGCWHCQPQICYLQSCSFWISLVLQDTLVCTLDQFAATNSDPKVAVSTVACLLVCQWDGVAFTMCKHAVTALPVT